MDNCGRLTGVGSRQLFGLDDWLIGVSGGRFHFQMLVQCGYSKVVNGQIGYGFPIVDKVGSWVFAFGGTLCAFGKRVAKFEISTIAASGSFAKIEVLTSLILQS